MTETDNRFPMLAGKTIVAGGSKFVYTPRETTFIELHFDDGTSLELRASSVMFDQYSSDPIIAIKFIEKEEEDEASGR